MIKKSLGVFILLIALSQNLFGKDLEDYAPSVNFKGLTGYYYVDSTQTLPKGQIQTTLFGVATQDDVTNFKRGSSDAVFSAGVMEGLETSLVIPYYRASGNLSGIGDLKIAGKVRLLNQLDEDLPSLGLAVSILLPTGDQNNGFRTVSSYGGDLLLIADGKIDLTDYAFYLTAEGGAFVQDIGQAREEKHYRYGGAGYFPVNDLIVLMLEASGTVRYGQLNDRDSATLSASLHFSTNKFKITGGVDRIVPVGVNSIMANGIHGSIGVSF